jgi:hypothetical protein
MLWGVTGADQNIPPATGSASTQGLTDSLKSYQIGGDVAGTFQLHLDTSGTNIVQDTPMSDLVEPTDPLYVPIELSTPSGDPYTDPAGNIYYLLGLQTFIPSESLIDVTGWFVTGVNTSSSAVPATATATEASGSVTAVIVTAGGSGYQIAPTVTIAPPTTGRTARAHAVLTGGVVTSIVVDDAGTGYTAAPTVAIGVPSTLQGGGTFDTAIPWVVGGAIPVVPACYAGAALP